MYWYMTVMHQCSVQVLTSIWLSLWSEDRPVNGTMDRDLIDLRLGVYGGLGVAQSTSCRVPQWLLPSACKMVPVYACVRCVQILTLVLPLYCLSYFMYTYMYMYMYLHAHVWALIAMFHSFRHPGPGRVIRLRRNRCVAQPAQGAADQHPQMPHVVFRHHAAG